MSSTSQPSVRMQPARSSLVILPSTRGTSRSSYQLLHRDTILRE
jgi:hypothetical protein